MNILSWAALAVLVYYAFKGWRRGLIMTVFFDVCHSDRHCVGGTAVTAAESELAEYRVF